VQRRATKLVESVKDLHFDERLKKLCLMRLDIRRDRSDLIETLDFEWELQCGYIFDLCSVWLWQVGTLQRLFKRWCGLGIRKFVFRNRIGDNWNSLSDNCVSCTTL